MNITQNLLSFVTFRGSNSKSPGTNITDADEVFRSSKAVPQFCWFYASYCGHCSTVYGDWHTLKKMCKDKPIELRTLECSENMELLNKFRKYGIQVNSFPTFKMVKNGQVFDYNKGRKAKDFYEWFESNKYI